MDPIKEAFLNVKQDIDYLYQEIQEIKASLEEHKEVSFNFIKRTLEELKTTTQNLQISTLQQETPTHPTHLEAPKSQYLPISTGNEGVPTNQPTNQPTIQHPPISTEKFAQVDNIPTQKIPRTSHLIPEKKQEKEEKIDRITQLQRASEILSSLDELKKEVRIKFKKLTNQEMLIYTTIYQLEEQGILVDYSIIAEKTGLSEISIRDYIRKIINKGVPLDKIKENNKKIVLKIPQNLKKIASLSTIQQLREI